MKEKKQYKSEVIRLNDKILPKHIVSYMCYLSKCVYNRAQYIKKEKWDRIKDLSKEERKGKYFDVKSLYSEFHPQYNYLSEDIVSYTLRLVEQNWKSYFASLRDFNKHPEKYKSIPKPPGFLKSDSEYMVIIRGVSNIKNDGCIYLNSKVREFEAEPNIKNRFKIKTRLSKDTLIKDVRIIPDKTNKVIRRKVETDDGKMYYKFVKPSCRNQYTLLITYEIKEKSNDLPNFSNVCGIDLGVARNFVTMTFNNGLKPIIIRSGKLKSINQFYNKRVGKLQSIYDTPPKVKVINRTQKSILTNKRNRQIKHYMHIISRFIVDYCYEDDIGIIVLGYNKGWKQEVNIGKKNTQNFVQLPFFKFKQMLEYKVLDKNIVVIEQEESYTSKCSFLDKEKIQKHQKYLGKRVNRGLFVSNNGTKINADVNGSLNIIRKSGICSFNEQIFIDKSLIHPLIINFSI